MNVNDFKACLFNITKTFFNDAVVRWGEQNSTGSDAPFVRLRLENVKKEQFPNQKYDDGFLKRFIPCTGIFVVELFTHGKKTDINGFTYYENTALNDMEEFCSFISSPLGIMLSSTNNISILTEGDVRDTSAVKDSDYEYRALQNFIVNFTLTSFGYSGLNEDSRETNPSGGGNSEIVNQEYYIEKIEMEEFK